MADKISPKELRDALQINVDKLDGERAQANSVARGLAAAGYRTPPSVTSGKMDGAVLRLYVWKGSPAGNLILATGAAFKPRILEASEIREQGPGIYILSSTDTTKARDSVARTAERYQSPRVSVERAPRAPLPPKAAARVQRATAPVREVLAAARGPSAESVADAKKAGIRDFLANLLGA